MPYTVENRSETEATVTIKVSREAVRQEVDRELRDLSGRVKMPGFRPGRVPRNLMEKKYGKAVEADVRQKLIEQEFRAAVTEHELRPLEAPTLEKEQLEKTDQDIELTFQLELVPNFPLGDYRGLRVSPPAITVRDEDVARELELLRQRLATVEPVDGPATTGDVIVADLHFAFLDGTTLPPMEKRVIDTRAGMVDGIPCEAAIGRFVGSSPGDRITLNLQLPGDYPLEEHRGKTAGVECHVRQIQRVHLPELDAPPVLERLGASSLEELKTRVHDSLSQRAEAQVRRFLEDQCIEQLLERHPFALPRGYVERAFDAERQRLRRDWMERGAPQEEVERKLLEVDGRLRARTERELRERMLLDRIAETERVEVDKDQVAQHFEMMSRALQIPAQQLFDHFHESGGLPAVLAGLRRDKVRALLREAAMTTDQREDQEDSSTSASSGEATS